MASPRSQWCLRNPFSHKFMLALLGSFIVLTLVNHYYLSNLSSDCDKVSHKSRNKLDYEDLTIDDRKNLDVKLHIEELHKIKISVSNELRDLESKRQSLQADIAGYTSHIETLRSQYGVLKKEITQVKLTLDQLKFEKEETKAFVPSIKAPQRIIMDTHPSQNMLPPSLPLYCKMETCFDFSRCSLVSGFPVFFYDLQEISLEYPALDEFILSSVVSSFGKSVYATDDPSSACVFIVLMGEIKDGTVNHEQLEHFLYSLPHWNGDGRNHLLINMAHTAHISDMFVNANTGRAVLVQSCFTSSTFRDGFDIVLPPSLGLADGDVWSEIPPLSPIRRKYLLSYWGEYIPTHERARVNDFLHNIKFQNSQDKVEQLRKLQAMQGREEGVVVRPRKLLDIGPELDDITLGSAIVSWLKELQLSMGDQAFVELSCSGSKVVGMETEWGLCGEAVHRADILSQSTFTLLLLPTNESLVSTGVFQTRLYEALKYGSVPIILGLQRRLPFSEVLRWENAVFTLPLPRVTEIPFFLRTFGDADISLYRSHGRNLWESYFGSTQRILDTVLAVLRTRLQIPAVPAREEPSYSVFNETFVPLKMEGPDPEPETDEVLGPIEPRFPSERFRRNYTHNWILQAFNMPGDPFSLYPFTPFEPVLPSESKFLGSGYGFRPVSQGMGGAGKEFSESLGGNYPREQFTIVMLTYERELMLVQALQRLKGLPFLNKVLVVWNNPSPPSSDLRWPEIGVPLEVVKTRRNSLNNRFLPYSAIETEAVLSIDDDAHLRHDEIVFGFRVWREERDQIVGFPGRYHAWDPKHHTWLYNSNYSCELSMVLTGAAFFHKYYAYLYSYVMPQAIRDKVDQYTNCEDIAMNFLVAHITRKPPIKVTSRWTFRCPGCQNTLSSNDTHFEERHHCINFFMSVYGYMPLLYTQYRVDSVLFKTRLPHDKQKCFKYI